MNQIEVRNHLGRNFGIPFIVKGAQESVKRVDLKPGLNYVDREAWDMVKDHPSVKIMLNTTHNSCVRRIKLMSGNDNDKNYANVKYSYNEDGREHKILEVKDLNDLTTSKKVGKSEIN